MRFVCLIFVVFYFCIPIKVSGQETFILRGVISKKLTAERIGQALITNMRTHDIMMSDEVGWFSIKTAVGDTILFRKADYTDQKIVVFNTSDIPVYMQPVIKLDMVTIHGVSKKQEVNDILKDYGSKGVYYNGDPPLASILLNPLNDLYTLFGKDAKDLKRFKTFSKGELEYAEVRKRYTPKLVKQVTNASDSTCKKFMEYYTPAYEDIKKWNDYELIQHIRKSYDYYDKNKDKDTFQHLNAPSLTTSDPVKLGN
jgi:hypothetical protein